MYTYHPESKVEVTGFVAKHYDKVMDIATFGNYSSFLRRAIRLMQIKPSDKILDLGAGTGRNDCLMAQYISSKGELIGLDISKEMIPQFKKNCAGFPNIKIFNKRIDESLPYKEYFDKAFMSFVLHGFPQEVRNQIIRNIFEALKNHGEFFILDYNEFLLDKMPFYLKYPFKSIECPYAFDFIARDWKKILFSQGFNHFEEHLFFKKYLRLLKAVKS